MRLELFRASCELLLISFTLRFEKQIKNKLYLETKQASQDLSTKWAYLAFMYMRNKKYFITTREKLTI